MPRYFTHYWKNSTWFYNQECETGQLLDHTAGDLFTKRGVGAGDIVYVVTVLSGKLYLGGKMAVLKICKEQEAAQYLGWKVDELWEAGDHLIAESATPMRFDLAVPHQTTVRLRFNGSKALKFSAPGWLDSQTLRGVREIEEASALLLDELLPPMRPVKAA
jgi:hypothetical protein